MGNSGTDDTPAVQCQETFAKICQITFGKSAVTDTVLKCYSPLVKVDS